jgi:hypothetical protein
MAKLEDSRCNVLPGWPPERSHDFPEIFELAEPGQGVSVYLENRLGATGRSRSSITVAQQTVAASVPHCFTAPR